MHIWEICKPLGPNKRAMGAQHVNYSINHTSAVLDVSGSRAICMLKVWSETSYMLAIASSSKLGTIGEAS